MGIATTCTCIALCVGGVLVVKGMSSQRWRLSESCHVCGRDLVWLVAMSNYGKGVLLWPANDADVCFHPLCMLCGN